MSHPTLLYSVDRVEGDVVLLEQLPDGQRLSVPTARLPHAKDGEIYRVPSGNDDAPDWDLAVRDLSSERTIREAARARLAKLSDQDPGGDLAL